MDHCNVMFKKDVSINGGTQQPWVFLLKMIILGCFGGTPIFGNTQKEKEKLKKVLSLLCTFSAFWHFQVEERVEFDLSVQDT